MCYFGITPITGVDKGKATKSEDRAVSVKRDTEDDEEEKGGGG